MPLVDKSLDKKIENQFNKAKKLQSKNLGTSASDANKLASSSKRTPEMAIQDVINNINTEASKGMYHTKVTVADQFLSKVTAYFKSKNYILFSNKSGLIICWIGGKEWERKLFGTKRVDNAEKEKAALGYIESLINKYKAPNSELKWINPTTYSSLGVLNVVKKIK
jgi:hypothetical protein